MNVLKKKMLSFLPCNRVENLSQVLVPFCKLLMVLSHVSNKDLTFRRDLTDEAGVKSQVNPELIWQQKKGFEPILIRLIIVFPPR